MYLEILNYQYQKSSTYLKQGVKNNHVPRRAVSGGCGTFVVADPPKLWVDVRNVETGEVQSVNMYDFVKDLLGDLRLTEKRAEKIIRHYEAQGQFYADSWTRWDDALNLNSVIK